MAAVALLSSWLWDCQRVTSVEELMKDTLKPAFLSPLSSFFGHWLIKAGLFFNRCLDAAASSFSFFFLNILCALVWLYGVSPKLLDYLYPALSLPFFFSFILPVRSRNTFLIRCQKKKEGERKIERQRMTNWSEGFLLICTRLAVLTAQSTCPSFPCLYLRAERRTLAVSGTFCSFTVHTDPTAVNVTRTHRHRSVWLSWFKGDLETPVSSLFWNERIWCCKYT